jgi:hypothetical protein
MAFIASIFDNVYTPPVIFSVVHDEGGNVIRACVDGRQRLLSIVKFLNGLVCFSLLSS